MKKLNIAFIWHFHQPNYQLNYDSDFLLPWVRLHASKDYLDMLKRMDKYENLKLNFNFSPVLLGALQKYLKGYKDIHLQLLIKKEDELNYQDKIFILNNYFDLNYKNMVLTRPYFTELYNARANAKELNVEMFSNQQYIDIMVNFTLCWIDTTFKSDYRDLEELFNKEKDYTFNDRQRIYEIQLDIIKRILKDYKLYQDENKIEISTSPYYHPILPLLIDTKNKEIKNFENLPDATRYVRDAKEQVDWAIDSYEELFGMKPRGMWLSEQCACSKTVELLARKGFKWTVLDEGILAKSLKREFERDFEGNLENPFNLNINYISKGKNPLNILFADSFFANLLNFGYGNYDYQLAANDMYEKIKTIQSKLQSSPKEEHILTIALDGENCWETYQNDGSEFLDTLYGLICADDTLETVLVDEFISKTKPQTLETLKAGSWINRNFDLWIGEATKNIAWLYLSSVSKDFEEYKASLSPEKKKELKVKLALAHREILIAQSSDWYWWYGEPNESKSDGIFDYLFRTHLMNVYEMLGLEIPQYLTVPLANATTRPLRNPVSEINPSLSCDIDDVKKEWEKAGLIFIPDGPTSNIGRLVKNIYFGYDKENIYFRFELNKNSVQMSYSEIVKQIAIYFKCDTAEHFSPIRYISKNENAIYPIVKNQFSKEVRFTFDNEKTSRLYFNKACAWGLWTKALPPKNSQIAYKDVIELKIAHSDLGFTNNEFSFFIVDLSNGVINEVYPQDTLIDLRKS